MTGDGGLIAISLSDCDNVLLWAKWTEVHRVLGLSKGEQELVDRLKLWRARHSEATP